MRDTTGIVFTFAVLLRVLKEEWNTIHDTTSFQCYGAQGTKSRQSWMSNVSLGDMCMCSRTKLLQLQIVSHAPCPVLSDGESNSWSGGAAWRSASHQWCSPYSLVLNSWILYSRAESQKHMTCTLIWCPYHICVQISDLCADISGVLNDVLRS